MALCECGCGQDAGVYANWSKGHKPGDPKRFIKGHQYDAARVDYDKTCENCGVTFRRKRLSSGRIEPVEAFREKKYCSVKCMGEAYAKNAPPTVFSQYTSEGEARWLINADTGCWEWQKAIRECNGYGICARNGKTDYAHRFSYETFVGPIPEGLELDHLCRNRKCVNPYHLEPVTHTVNMRRGARTILTPEQVIEIREMDTQGYTRREMAEMFEVSKGCIDHVVYRYNWKDLDV